MKEALKLAYDYIDEVDYGPYDSKPVLAAIKEALAQTEQEPVAWGVFEGNLHDMFFSQEEAQEMADLKGTNAEVRPLYTTPPQRTWVGLTDEEVDQFHNWKDCTWSTNELVRYVEQTLKDKNT